MRVVLGVKSVATIGPVPGVRYARGHRLVLDPENYPTHSELLKQLLMLPGWVILEGGLPMVASAPEVLAAMPAQEALLPHQAEAIAKLRG